MNPAVLCLLAQRLHAARADSGKLLFQLGDACVLAAQLCGGLPAPMVFRKTMVLQKSFNFVFIRQAQRLGDPRGGLLVTAGLMVEQPQQVQRVGMIGGGALVLVATGLVTGFNPLQWLGALRRTDD